MDLTENMKIWLHKLYLEAAEDARGAASNSHLFALGSEGEAAALHEENAEELRDYADILEKMAHEMECGVSLEGKLSDAIKRSTEFGRNVIDKEEFAKE